MRAIGFALIIIGCTTIYLAWKGKIGAALTALLTGQAPSSSNQNPIKKIAKQAGQAALDVGASIGSTATNQKTQNIINKSKLPPVVKQGAIQAVDPFLHGGAFGS